MKRLLAIILVVNILSSCQPMGSNLERVEFVQPQVYMAKIIINSKGVSTLLSHGYVFRRLDSEKDGVTSIQYPQTVIENKKPSGNKILEIYAKSKEVIITKLQSLGTDLSEVVNSNIKTFQNAEVNTLLNNGLTYQRIDFVLLGDGYTLAEKEKFHKDCAKVVNEMCTLPTFQSFLPLFNIHTVFTPSNESGIGYGKPKDTVFGLYRPDNTLRAILISKAQDARDACSLAPACGIPIIIANDPYYGGIGGEFAVTTNSNPNGIIVLRHELGHTIGKVGDEYDGGGYWGVNYSKNINDIPWRDWLTEGFPPTAEPSSAYYIQWPWYNLGKGPFELKFKSFNNDSILALRFSITGLSSDSDTVNIFFNDNLLNFQQINSPDRFFYDLILTDEYSPINHTLRFIETHPDGDNILSSITVHGYNNEFHFQKNFIGAFPLYSTDNQLEGYRPTNESCLMRNIYYDRFCPVCQENLWLKMIRMVPLVDKFLIEYGEDTVDFTVEVPKLGQYRTNAMDFKGEKIIIRWFHEDKEIRELRDKLLWQGKLPEVGGNWRLLVRFITPEVKNDPNKYLEREISFPVYYIKKGFY